MSVKQGLQYVKHCALGYRKVCVVRISMFSSEACKFNLDKIYEHFPAATEGCMLHTFRCVLKCESILVGTVPVQPSKLMFLLSHHVATNPFGLGRLFDKSSRQLQTFRHHAY